jgi:hypothetical protein
MGIGSTIGIEVLAYELYIWSFYLPIRFVPDCGFAAGGKEKEGGDDLIFDHSCVWVLVYYFLGCGEVVGEAYLLIRRW